MIGGMIVLGALLVVSVIAHFFFWRSSQKHYNECMKQVKALNERLEQLTATDIEMGRMLDDAEKDAEKIGKEFDALRSVWFMKEEKNRTTN